LATFCKTLATLENGKHVEKYLTPKQVCEELLPGMTPTLLAQLRYNGTGPEYFAPTPRKILYSEERVRAWVESSARTRTDGRSALAG